MGKARKSVVWDSSWSVFLPTVCPTVGCCIISLIVGIESAWSGFSSVHGGDFSSENFPKSCPFRRRAKQNQCHAEK